MVLPSTVVLTMDNSGARRVRCIKIYKKPGRSRAVVGDVLKVIVVRLRNRGMIRVKQGEVHIAVVTRISTPIFRNKKGIFFKFDKNTVVMLSKKKVPVGTRIFGPCAKELRNKNFSRIISLSGKLV